MSIAGMIAWSQQLEQSWTIPIDRKTAKVLSHICDVWKLLAKYLLGAFKELQLLGIQQTGHKFNIKAGAYHVKRKTRNLERWDW